VRTFDAARNQRLQELQRPARGFSRPREHRASASNREGPQHTDLDLDGRHRPARGSREIVELPQRFCGRPFFERASTAKEYLEVPPGEQGRIEKAAALDDLQSAMGKAGARARSSTPEGAKRAREPAKGRKRPAADAAGG